MSRPDQAFAELVGANPVPDLQAQASIHKTWREDLLARISREPLNAPGRRRSRPSSRFVLAGVAGLALAALPSYAVGRGLVGWLGGEPAPQEIVSDFGKYRPELGFDPEPGKATLVAEDSGVRLYVTTNRQGSYCYIIGTRLDGGSCTSKAVAGSRVVAGLVGQVSSDQGDVLVVIGRTLDERAVGVRFTSPTGEVVMKPIVAGGFFIAGVPTPASEGACVNGDWSSQFSFHGSDGNVVAEAAFVLAVSSGVNGEGGVCSFGGLQGS